MAIYNKPGEGVVNELSIDASDVLLDPYTQNPVYQFSPKYILNTNLSKVSSGIGVIRNVDNEFNFDIRNRYNTPLDESSMENDVFFNGIEIDILNKNKQTITGGFASGDLSSLEFTKNDNIEIFSSFTKDYGIRMKIDDQTNLSDHVSEYYVYGNPLYIKSVKVNDFSGEYINYDPIGLYQVYKPYVSSQSSFEVVQGEENLFYLPKLSLTSNDKNVSVNMKIVFASGKQEKLKINWGDGTEDNIFYYTSPTNFIGPGVTRTDTNTEDEILKDYDSLLLIDGKTYEFTKSHTYTPISLTGYPVSIGVAESNSADFEEILNNEVLLPSFITGAGIMISTGGISGSIEFEFEFLNDENYTSFDKIEIYGTGTNNSTLESDSFLHTEDLYSPDQYGKYQISLDAGSVQPNVNYWFTLLPYSQIATGYAWTVGPYLMQQDIDDSIEGELIEASMIILSGGTSSSTSTIIESLLSGTGFDLIDTIDYNLGVLSSEYYINAVNQVKDVCSLKLLMNNNIEAYTENRKSLHLSEYSISDNCYLEFSGSTGTNSFSLYGRINNTFGEPPEDTYAYVSLQRNLISYDTGILNDALEEEGLI